MSGFVAIDFETANESRASACALGWAVFEDGSLVVGGSTLIAPEIEAGAWSPFNVAIHGIRPADVRGAPVFAEAWQQLTDLARGRPLLAHYAAFDMSVLRAELARLGIAPAALRYACSATLARRAWPELLSVSLPVIARQLGLPLEHHDPRSDAEASAAIAVAAFAQLGVADLPAALASQSVAWGEVRADLTWTPCGVSAMQLSEMRALSDEFDPAHPYFGQVVVFTGALTALTRREAFQRVLDVGGRPEEGVTKDTNVLVVGEQDIRKLASGQTLSAKQRKAAVLRLAGRDIQMIGEVDFLTSL